MQSTMAKETVLLVEKVVFILFLHLAFNPAYSQWAYYDLRAAFEGTPTEIINIEDTIEKSAAAVKGESGNLVELIQEIPVSETKRIINDFMEGKDDPDVDLSIVELLSSYGHKVKIYQVETEDRYLITMYRLKGEGQPVLLMHGLLGSADDFVTPGPKIGLAYLLAAQGYDVWLGNARGTVHSRAHKWLSPDSADFWHFSWDEIGLYDLPAMIDLVLGETGRSQLKYIGHSQGATSFFVMCSMKPEYNKKISIMVALSAVSYMSHLRSPIIRLFSSTNSHLEDLLEVVGRDKFTPSDEVLRTLESSFCGNEDLGLVFCANIQMMMSGFNYEQLNITNLPVLFSHTPAGAATKQLLHYAQGLSGEFRRYNHGVVKNLAAYRSMSPPTYPLELVSTPVAIFYSHGDWMASPADVKTLRNKLPNVINFYQIPLKQFSHMDFLWAKDIQSLVVPRLLHLLDKY